MDGSCHFVHCLRLLGLVIFAPILVARGQSVARLGVLSWSYEARGIYPPSYGLPAQVSIEVRIEARADSDTIAGTGLWELTVFGNSESDGSGASRYDTKTGFLSDAYRAQTLSPTDSLEFDEEIAFDLSGLACGADGPFLCVEVTPADGASMDFVLDHAWLGCQSIPCYYPEESYDAGRYVSFSQLLVDLDAPLVLHDEPADILLDLTAVPSTSSRRHVEGTGLWKVSIFGSTTDDGSGDRYDERPQILSTAENTDKSLLPAESLELTVRTLFLLGGVGCDYFPYFCVTLGKGDNPQPNFEMESSITACRAVTCLYPDDPPIWTARIAQMLLSLQLPPHYPYDAPADINLKVALTPSQRPQVPTSVIEGTGLWRLAIFSNKNADGSDEIRFDERPQVLSESDQEASLSPTSGLIFNVTTPFLIGRCAEYPHFCVEFLKGYSPVPNFILASTVAGCLEVPCAYDPLPVARLARLSWSFTELASGSYGDPVRIGLNVTVEPSESPATDVIVGSRLWKVSIYGSSSADGSGGDRFDEKSVLTTCQQEKALAPKRPLVFDIDTGFVITGVGCPYFPYFCVTFAKGDNPEPDFIMHDSLTTCTELTCIPPPVPKLVVRDLILMVKSGSPTSLQAGQDGTANYLKFQVEVEYDKMQSGEITGSHLWMLAWWGSANADGSGPKINEDPQVLRSTQAKNSLTLGEDFVWTSVRENFDMTGLTCDDVRYICVKLSRGSAPAEAFEFLTEPESYVPQTCLQMGCS